MEDGKQGLEEWQETRTSTWELSVSTHLLPVIFSLFLIITVSVQLTGNNPDYVSEIFKLNMT